VALSQDLSSPRRHLGGSGGVPMTEDAMLMLDAVLTSSEAVLMLCSSISN